MFQGD